MNKLPVSRRNEVVVQQMDGETLIYDLQIHQAFCLNETAGIVYNACNGQTTFTELKKKHQFTDELIFLALDELQKQNLLEDKYYSSPFAGMSRREVVRKIGLSTMAALPLIAFVTAPTALNAQSGAPPAAPPPLVCPGGCSAIPSMCPCSLNCSDCVGGTCNTITGMCT